MNSSKRNGSSRQSEIRDQQRSKAKINKNTFYLKPKAAHKLIAMIDEEFPLKEFNRIVDPSAGKGSFAEYFYDQGYPLDAYDEKPIKPFIVRKDFLDVAVAPYKKKYRNVLVIGHPPDGYKGSIAKQFVTKSCEFASVIALVLPKAFKKKLMKSAFSSAFKLKHSYILAESAFVVPELGTYIPCLFQVWERSNIASNVTSIKSVTTGLKSLKSDKHDQKQKDEMQSAYFKFVSQGDRPDFSIRKTGVYSGKLSAITEDKQPNTHYFIKINDGFSKKQFRYQYNLLRFDLENDAAQRLMTKSELVTIINKLELRRRE